MWKNRKKVFAPPISSLKTLDGKTVDLANNGGKPSFINIWASWCPPCRVEMPHIQEAYRKIRGSGQFSHGQFDGVGRYGSDAGVPCLRGIYFPVLLDEKGEVGDRYGVVSIPVTFAVDEQGVIVHKQMGMMSKQQIFDLMEQLAK